MKKITKIAILTLILLTSVGAKAQLANGSVAPNFTAADINGNTWDLYTILGQGKTVFIDISATWCAPCWSFHQSGCLDSIWSMHGPAGQTGVNANTTDDVFVFFIEGDGTTNTACLSGSTGCNSTTQGDWVTGTNYPIIDNATIANNFQVGYFPTLYIICPDKIVRNCSPSETGTYNTSYYLGLKQQYCYVATAANDASLQNSPANQVLMSCDSVTPNISIENLSTTTLTSATVTYKVDGVVQKTYNWTGSLATYAKTNVTGIKLGSSTPGVHTITATVSNPNSGADVIAANDDFSVDFTIFATSGVSPISEGFETLSFPGSGWILQNGGDQTVTWKETNVCSGFGNSTESLTLRFYNSPSGDVDAFIMPPQSTLGMTSALLKFDVAYAGYTASSPETDKLVVKVSKNCGLTWSSIYTKSGNTLKTASPTSTDFTPTSTQWRTETITLASSFLNQGNVLIKFEGTSNYGNNLYLDNINLADATGIESINTISSFNLFPNPATDKATLEVVLASTDDLTVSVYNNLGQAVISQKHANMVEGENKININTSELPAGIYTITLNSKQGSASQRLAVFR